MYCDECQSTLLNIPSITTSCAHPWFEHKVEHSTAARPTTFASLQQHSRKQGYEWSLVIQQKTSRCKQAINKNVTRHKPTQLFTPAVLLHTNPCRNSRQHVQHSIAMHSFQRPRKLPRNRSRRVLVLMKTWREPAHNTIPCFLLSSSLAASFSPIAEKTKTNVKISRSTVHTKYK